jgi:hypothetical protein
MKHISTIVFCTLLYGQNLHAQFEGELVLEPDGCEEIEECYIKNKLRYTDPNTLVWEAEKGLKTDGATLPKWAEPFIGKPYDESFIRAAVVHDHYCDRHVRSWRSTHRVWYHMLIDLGVPKAKAKIMYYAVFVGGPKWIEIVEPKDCGQNCINEFNKLPESEKLNYQPSSYDTIENFEARLSNFETLLADSDLTLEQIDEFAVKEDPQNVYFKNGDSIEFDPKKGLEF